MDIVKASAENKAIYSLINLFLKTLNIKILKMIFKILERNLFN